MSLPLIFQSIHPCSFSYFQTYIDFSYWWLYRSNVFLEFQLSEEPDWTFMREKHKQISFLFGDDDHWGPLTLFEQVNTRFYHFHPSAESNWCTFFVRLKKEKKKGHLLFFWEAIIRVRVDVIQITSNSVFWETDTNPWAEQLWQADKRNLIVSDAPLSASSAPKSV